MEKENMRLPCLRKWNLIEEYELNSERNASVERDQHLLQAVGRAENNWNHHQEHWRIGIEHNIGRKLCNRKSTLLEADYY